MDEFCGSEYWDLNVIWNTTNPDFPVCFQKTSLAWIPTIFLVAFSPIAIWKMKTNPKQKGNDYYIPWTILNLAKTISILILLCTNIFILMYNIERMNQSESADSEPVFLVDFVTPTLDGCTLLLIFALEMANWNARIHSSAILFFFWVFKSISIAIAYRTVLTATLSVDSIIDVEVFVAVVILFPLTISQIFLTAFADTVVTRRKKKRINPKELASPISIATYSFFDRLAWTGFKRNLVTDDLWPLEDIYVSSEAFSVYDKLWTKEKQRVTSEKRLPSIFKIIWKMNRSQFIIAVFVKWVDDLMNFVSPLMLKQLINFVSSTDPSWKGYLYAATIFLATFVGSFCRNDHYYRMQRIGIRARAAVISAIYRKALKMSASAKRTSTVGEIVNLMSVDSQKIMDMWQFIGHATSMPLLVSVAMYLLWDMLGPSVFVGLVVIILMIPVNAYLAGKLSKFQVELMRFKDQRTKLMNEILIGMKVLKLYAWELPFSNLVNKVRASELVSLKKTLYLQAVTTFIFQCTPFLISLMTFTTYVLIDPRNILDATTAFVSLSLFDIMRVPLNFVPMVVAILIQAHVSIKRINKFMANNEIDPDGISHDFIDDDPVVIEDSTFAWDMKNNGPILHDINLRIPAGKLVAVVGTVGSGKSSLVSAIMGEMEKVNGRVNTNGSVAYVSQQAWIQNATLKNNILFGKPCSASHYEEVLEVCALKPDLAILPGGDSTEIGEKGINLSGGQKQRVSLARAVYNDADLYLLDDPLSAVDANVGKHIFDKVIGPKGVLKNKTRVLVTHGIAYLPYVDSIVVLSNGRIAEHGAYKELLAKEGDFSDFIMTYLKEQESFSEVEVEELKEIQDGILGEIENETIRRRLSRHISRAISSDDEASSSSARKSSPIRRRRSSSRSSRLEREVVPTPQSGQLIQEEQMEIGKVDTAVYIYYLKSVGCFLSALTFILLVFGWSSSVGSNIWLSIWSSDGPLPDGTQDIPLRNLRLGIYGALGFSQAIFALIAAITLALGSVKASTILHDVMLRKVIRSPMSFFDTTPLGRIVNRFSRDVDVTDITIPTFLRPVLDCFLQIIGTVVVISLGNPIFLAIFLPLTIIYYFIQRVYIDVSRQLKRLESISRSPIYSHFSETISGLSTIRAFHVEDSFINVVEAKVDYNHVLYYPILVAKRWLGIRLEGIGAVIVLTAGIFAVTGRDTMDPGTVGLSVSYAMSVTFVLMWLVRNWTDLETNIVSVERMKEYIELESEAPWSVDEFKPYAQWPHEGTVQFKEYSTRYREGLDLVLKGISCDIHSGEKIGIVGRTGAGKSSLTLGLFRIIEAAGGSINIDGIDIAIIGLHDLRSRLTIIPQDPVLFCGSLRMNLDPLDEHTDREIWRALENSHLKEYVMSLPAGLDHEISEGGENLSVGQRQLVCLARALLRKTKVLILDEATAAIDLETDDLIQATIRKEFADCTVITIAHRLNTIMDSTRVLVLHEGLISEFDSPSELLQRKDSKFYSMAKDAGLI